MGSKLTVFTDGSVWPNPGRSALAFYVEETGHKYYEPLEFSTNNKSELLAIRAAVKHLAVNHPDAVVTLYSDSEWGIRSITGRYKAKKNAEIIKEIREISEPLTITFKHCRAHCGIVGNEVADSLASIGLKEAIERWGAYS